MSDENNETPQTADENQTVSQAEGQQEHGAAEEKGNSSFKNKFLKFLDSGVEASKKGINNAGKAISDFSDKSVVRIEITQLNSKLEKLYKELGKLTADCLASDDQQAVSAQTSGVGPLLQQIAEFRLKLTQKEESLKTETEKK